MEAGIFCSAIVPHTPRMAVEGTAPDFLKGVIEGAKAFGEALRARKPDVIVLVSSHWVCTFNWYATTHPRHRGHCVADECPDLIPGLAYDRPGDPDLAEAIIAQARAGDIAFNENSTEHYVWDYGAYVPLHYLDPAQNVPVVLLPVCLASDFDECAAVGAAVERAAQSLGRRVAFIASSALAHKVVRGPDKWPGKDHQALDRDFIAQLCRGEIADARAGLPDYARGAVVEMGARPIATVLGGLDAGARTCSGEQFGAYGQSSGSGNACVAIWRSGA